MGIYLPTHLHTMCPQRPEERVGSPGTELQITTDHHVGAGFKPGSSAGAASTLMAKPSLQSLFFCQYGSISKKLMGFIIFQCIYANSPLCIYQKFFHLLF